MNSLSFLYFIRCLCLVSIFCASGFFYQPAQAEPAKALRLDQTHSFFGRCQLTVIDNALRLENLGQLKFVLVAKAPDWKVTVFRNDDRIYCSQSLKDFQSTGMISGFILPVPDHFLTNKIVKKSVEKVSGHEVNCITTTKCVLKYVALGKVAQQVDGILLAAYKLPTNGGIPVYFKKASKERDYYSDRQQADPRHIDTLLTTSKIETVPYNAAMFSLPSGFKPVKSLQEIVAGPGAKSKTADFQELFEMKSVGSQRK